MLTPRRYRLSDKLFEMLIDNVFKIKQIQCVILFIFIHNIEFCKFLIFILIFKLFYFNNLHKHDKILYFITR